MIVMPTFTRLAVAAQMKHETVEQIKTAAPAVFGTGLTWGLHEWSQAVSLLVGLATLFYILLQAAFLLRKWWVREKFGWGLKLPEDTE